MKGDCLSCARLGRCSETSVEKVLHDFTCILYEPVEEPVYKARVTSMELYGDVPAVQAMIDKPEDQEDEEEENDNG